MKYLSLKKERTAEELEDRKEKLMEKAFDSLPDEGGAFRVFRKDEKGRMRVLGVIPAEDVINPDDFLTTLDEKWGGGRYHVLPTRNGKKCAEGFPVEFEAEAKKPKKNTSSDEDSTDKRSGKKSKVQTELEEVKYQLRVIQEKEREDKLIARMRAEVLSAIPKQDDQGKLIEGILSNFPAVVTGLSGIMGNRETAADLLEKVTTIWTNIEGTMPKAPDPVAQAKDLAELLFSMADRVKPPPVSTGGASSGIASFINSLIDQVGRKYMQQQAPGQPTVALPGMPPQLHAQGVGFSGVPGQASQGTQQQGSSQAMGQAPPGNQGINIPVQSLFQSMGIDPVMKIRSMLKGRADPEDVAQHVVYMVDFLGTFLPPNSPFMPYLASFLDHPAENFDRACKYIPELVQFAQQDQEYLAGLKQAIVQGIREYKKQIEQVQQVYADMQPGIEAEESEREPADVEESQEPALAKQET